MESAPASISGLNSIVFGDDLTHLKWQGKGEAGEVFLPHKTTIIMFCNSGVVAGVTGLEPAASGVTGERLQEQIQGRFQLSANDNVMQEGAQLELHCFRQSFSSANILGST